MPDTLNTQMDKVQYWKAFDAQRWGYLRWGVSRFRKALKDQITPVLSNMDRGVSAGLGSIESISADPLREAFLDVYGKVGGHFAFQVYSSFKDGVPQMQTKQDESLFEQFVREWVKVNGAARVQAITNTTRDRIRMVLDQSISDGLGIEETTRMIMSRVIGVSRARVIARTEIISASNKGSLHGANQTNLNLLKEWISSQDARTRRLPEDKTDHFTIDGQIQELDAPFEIPHLELGVDFVQFPGDPNGRPESVIMCRCTQGYRRK